MKLNLGCGKDYKQGWVNVDIDEDHKADVYHDLTLTPLPFRTESASYVLLNHTLEHLTFEEGINLLQDLYRILRENGILEVAVPDLLVAMRDFLNGDDSPFYGLAIERIYGNQSTPCEVHKSGYSKKSLTELLNDCDFAITYDLSTEAEVRFKCKKLERVDETGVKLRQRSLTGAHGNTKMWRGYCNRNRKTQPQPPEISDTMNILPFSSAKTMVSPTFTPKTFLTSSGRVI